MEDERETSALRNRRKKSSMRLSCCFNTSHRRGGSLDVFSSSLVQPSPNRRSPSSWLRSKTHDLPEIKGKCKNLVSRMGKHRRHSSADFSYDPLSYSLNFENQDELSDGDEPIRNFSSRLPASPPRATIVASTPSAGKMLSVSKRKSDERPASRAAAVAEVVKNLELSPVDLRRNLELPKLRRPGDVNRKTDDVKGAEQRNVVPGQSKSIDRSSPRAAVAAEVRRNLELEDVPPSRQVLVELY